MTTTTLDTSLAARMLCEQFCIRSGETVVVTADNATDTAVIDAVIKVATERGAQTVLLMLAKLPYQGMLADPYIPQAVAHAVAASDVWFDMTFPYMAGSSAHDEAMKAGRTRYLMIGDVNAGSLQRLYGSIELDKLFEVQAALDDLMSTNVGASCRVVAPNGTDFTFRLGKPGGKKSRYADRPGTSTIMGSCIFYPDPESVQGVIALDAIFHEFYTVLAKPIRLHVDGEIRTVEHVPEHADVTERALRRAARGSYGGVVHLSCGFHPATHFSGHSFIEDIRTVGANAIGLGMPWWVPGGGENHPDGVVTHQSLWIEGEEILKDGHLVGPSRVVQAVHALG